jgi:hypothetical protein
MVELIHQCIDTNFKSSHSFLLQFVSYIQLTAMKSLDENQVIFPCHLQKSIEINFLLTEFFEFDGYICSNCRCPV